MKVHPGRAPDRNASGVQAASPLCPSPPCRWAALVAVASGHRCGHVPGAPRFHSFPQSAQRRPPRPSGIDQSGRRQISSLRLFARGPLEPAPPKRAPSLAEARNRHPQHCCACHRRAEARCAPFLSSTQEKPRTRAGFEGRPVPLTGAVNAGQELTTPCPGDMRMDCSLYHTGSVQGLRRSDFVTLADPISQQTYLLPSPDRRAPAIPAGAGLRAIQGRS